MILLSRTTGRTCASNIAITSVEQKFHSAAVTRKVDVDRKSMKLWDLN